MYTLYKFTSVIDQRNKDICPRTKVRKWYPPFREKNERTLGRGVFVEDLLRGSWRQRGERYDSLFREILYAETRASGKISNPSCLINSKPSVRESARGPLTPAYANVYHVRPELLRNSESEAGYDRSAYRTALHRRLVNNRSGRRSEGLSLRRVSRISVWTAQNRGNCRAENDQAAVKACTARRHDAETRPRHPGAALLA